jgi:diadenylate cyclase
MAGGEESRRARQQLLGGPLASRHEKEKDLERTAEKGPEKVEKAPARRAGLGEDSRLGRLLGPTSLLDIRAGSKEELLRDLARAVARDRGLPDPEPIFQGAMEREALVNTYLGDGVAVPHARIPGFNGFALALARNPEGFPYGVETSEPVKLVMFLVGDESQMNEHVRYLGAIAQAMKDGSLRQRILDAPGREAVAMALDASRKFEAPRRRPHHLSRLLLSHARKISREVGATAVLVAVDSPEELAIIKRLPRRERFIVAASSPAIAESAAKVVDRVIHLPWSPLRRDSLLRLGTLIGISSGLIARDDVVAFISRQAGGGLDTITVLDVGREFGKFLNTAGEISRKVLPGVLERVLILASELAVEGREGKPIGTIFVVGEPQELAPFCQQMVINPFRGYPPEERNVLDPTLRETIKEFSWLDGAFIIRGDGAIHSAGTYLRPGKVEVSLPGGYGTRHRAACAITAVADCFSLAISQSSGNVMLFKKGETVLTLEKGSMQSGVQK